MMSIRPVAFAAAFAAASIFMASAHAQGWMGGRMDTNALYVGGGAGVTRAPMDTVGLIGTTDERDTGWKLFAGYQFNRYAAIEAGYVDLGKASFTGTLAIPIPPFPAGTAATLSQKSKAYTVSAVGSLPLGSSDFALIGRVGVAYAKATADVALGGAVASVSDETTELTYGLGLRYDITRNIAVRAEWERFRVGGSNLGGKNDVDLFTLNGFYRF
jgi:OOP family OmpA-OmpF porin